MRSSLFALPLIAAFCANAQTRFPTPSPKVLPGFAQVDPHSNIAADGWTSCPVGLSAQQHGAPQTLWTIALEDRNDPQLTRQQPAGYGVHVVLAASPETILRSAELEVIYDPPGLHVLPIAAANAATRSKTFHIEASRDAAQKLQANLLLGHVAGIESVGLISLTFADGQTWHTHAGNTCTVHLSLYLPITN